MSVAARSYTPRYQAPGKVGVLTSLSDLYAVGVIIQELVDEVRGRAAGDLEKPDGEMAMELQTLATALMSPPRVDSAAASMCDGSTSPAEVAREFIDRMMVAHPAAVTPTKQRADSIMTEESVTPPVL